MKRAHQPRALLSARRPGRAFLWLTVLAALTFISIACASVSNPEGWAGPVLDGDNLYVSLERGKMAALDPADLSVKWIFPPEEAKKLKLEGIYGAPVTSNEAVYFGAHDGHVYALNADDGLPFWGFNANGDIARFKTGDPIVGAVTLVDGKLYAGSTDGVLYVIDAKEGTEIARFDTGSSIWAAPLVTDDAIYVAAMDGTLYALGVENLEVIWEKPLSGAGLLVDPVLADENTLLTGGIEKTLFALDPATGDEKWSLEAGNWFWGELLVDGDTIYAPNLDSKVYALGLDGEAKWEQPFTAQSSLRSSPLLTNDALVIVDKDGAANGLDPATGALTWGPTLLGKTVLSNPFLLDDAVLIVSQGGDLFRIDPENGAQSVVAVPN